MHLKYQLIGILVLAILPLYAQPADDGGHVGKVEPKSAVGYGLGSTGGGRSVGVGIGISVEENDAKKVPKKKSARGGRKTRGGRSGKGRHPSRGEPEEEESAEEGGTVGIAVGESGATGIAVGGTAGPSADATGVGVGTGGGPAKGIAVAGEGGKATGIGLAEGANAEEAKETIDQIGDLTRALKTIRFACPCLCGC